MQDRYNMMLLLLSLMILLPFSLEGAAPKTEVDVR